MSIYNWISSMQITMTNKTPKSFNKKNIVQSANSMTNY